MTGELLWKFRPDAPLWNFMGSFAGDGTFTFQDSQGGVYRNNVRDGTNIWKVPGIPGSWTDGSSMLGPNRVVYAVRNKVPLMEEIEGVIASGKAHPGEVSAYHLNNGTLLWQVSVPMPPNNMPAIGRVAGHQWGFSLVQPMGQQSVRGQISSIHVLDAMTGEKRWVFDAPAQRDEYPAGDSNMVARFQRLMSGLRPLNLPNPWSTPTIDANGVVFIGNQEGGFYALQDADGNGVVEGSEVSMFNTSACFSGSSSAAIADQMVVATSTDAMYVFKGPQVGDKTYVGDIANDVNRW